VRDGSRSVRVEPQHAAQALFHARERARGQDPPPRERTSATMQLATASCETSTIPVVSS
jgi:hypothetical protein